MKAAIFSALDARGLLLDAVVLDLYAGCGALGLEAVSRGAAEVSLVDSDRAAQVALRANVEALGMASQARVLATTADSAARAVGTVDLVFADPPYDTATTVVDALLATLATRVPGGTIVLERPTRSDPVQPPAGWAVTWTRTFGDTLVVFVQEDTNSSGR
mgnify:CR=1 FL=1